MIDRKDVISVNTELSLAKAIDRMNLFGHRALPVVNMGRYFGVIDMDAIYQHLYVRKDVDLDVAVVSDVMRDNIQIVFASEFVERAAVAFYNQRYQFVPVLMDGTTDQFLGIIPISTIMDIFASTLGLNQTAHRITCEVYDYRGELAKLTRALMQSGANITSFATVLYKEGNDQNATPRIRLVMKFEGDLEQGLAAVRAQGARVTHIDRYEGDRQS